ncbi:hypothetical protein LOD99_13762 [Oopsacas minuta]|uniref:Selenocysteine-specific elongation factor n=1 Tax=Oopsacas minuta TaxID=111878 RepID=A0AAV7KJD9_9METZ|nr:hypothetical protein LOD99_13762 [Oopsacas minuta]
MASESSTSGDSTVQVPPQQVLNVNVGVLGHVDSGKTSLCAVLSTIASTASFDKSRQSKERGITLDLGFSCFLTPVPEHLCSQVPEQISHLQYTLVDCPGHASLIRTIIGGAQIIDMMILVLDITKGIQTQTAECLVICRITQRKLLVVLNKVDMLEESKRVVSVERTAKRMRKALQSMDIEAVDIVAVSARPDGIETSIDKAIGIRELISCLNVHTDMPVRTSKGPFLFAVDHCFLIRGQGTVMTGTVLSGIIRVNDAVLIPALSLSRKVKSMQMFRQPVQSAMQGDRLGICVTHFEPKLLERGLLCSPGAVQSLYAAIVQVNKIPFFKFPITSKSKLHISIGHETAMANILLFSSPHHAMSKEFSFAEEYTYVEDFSHTQTIPIDTSPVDVEGACVDTQPIPNTVYALLEFEKPVICSLDALLIGSKLDMDIHTNQCRIAFQGNVLCPMTDKNYTNSVLPSLKVIKFKQKEGIVDRIQDEYTVIVKSLFKKETHIDLFINKKVTLSTGEVGTIEGTFGSSGKIRIRLNSGLFESSKKLLEPIKKKGNEKNVSSEQNQQSIVVTLRFKKYLFEKSKTIFQ